MFVSPLLCRFVQRFCSRVMWWDVSIFQWHIHMEWSSGESANVSLLFGCFVCLNQCLGARVWSFLKPEWTNWRHLFPLWHIHVLYVHDSHTSMMHTCPWAIRVHVPHVHVPYVSMFHVPLSLSFCPNSFHVSIPAPPTLTSRNKWRMSAHSNTGKWCSITRLCSYCAWNDPSILPWMRHTYLLFPSLRAENMKNKSTSHSETPSEINSAESFDKWIILWLWWHLKCSSLHGVIVEPTTKTSAAEISFSRCSLILMLRKLAFPCFHHRLL